MNWNLTAREEEVLELLKQGASTDTISAELTISKPTTRNHIQSILRKHGASTRLEAVAIAGGGAVSSLVVAVRRAAEGRCRCQCKVKPPAPEFI